MVDEFLELALECLGILSGLSVPSLIERLKMLCLSVESLDWLQVVFVIGVIGRKGFLDGGVLVFRLTERKSFFFLVILGVFLVQRDH